MTHLYPLINSHYGPQPYLISGHNWSTGVRPSTDTLHFIINMTWNIVRYKWVLINLVMKQCRHTFGNVAFTRKAHIYATNSFHLLPTGSTVPPPSVRPDPRDVHTASARWWVWTGIENPHSTVLLWTCQNYTYQSTLSCTLSLRVVYRICSWEVVQTAALGIGAGL